MLKNAGPTEPTFVDAGHTCGSGVLSSPEKQWCAVSGVEVYETDFERAVLSSGACFFRAVFLYFSILQ